MLTTSPRLLRRVPILRELLFIMTQVLTVFRVIARLVNSNDVSSNTSIPIRLPIAQLANEFVIIILNAVGFHCLQPYRVVTRERDNALSRQSSSTLSQTLFSTGDSCLHILIRRHGPTPSVVVGLCGPSRGVSRPAMLSMLRR
jgi:hypothetical protein